MPPVELSDAAIVGANVAAFVGWSVVVSSTERSLDVPGTVGHMATEMFIKSAGLEIARIPYKGNGPAVGDMIGGHIKMMVQSIQTVIGNARGGTLRALAVTTAQRSVTSLGNSRSVMVRLAFPVCFCDLKEQTTEECDDLGAFVCVEWSLGRKRDLHLESVTR